MRLIRDKDIEDLPLEEYEGVPYKQWGDALTLEIICTLKDLGEEEDKLVRYRLLGDLQELNQMLIRWHLPTDLDRASKEYEKMTMINKQYATDHSGFFCQYREV